MDRESDYQIIKIGSHSKPFDMMVKLDKSMRKYSYDKQNYVIHFAGTWKLKEMFPKSVYQKGKPYPSEDIEAMGWWIRIMCCHRCMAAT